MLLIGRDWNILDTVIDSNQYKMWLFFPDFRYSHSGYFILFRFLLRIFFVRKYSIDKKCE